jgi:hypothetical protein
MRLLAVPLAATLLLAGASAADADLPDFKHKTIKPDKAIGGAKIGQSRARAVKAWGGAKRAAFCDTSGCSYEVAKGDPTHGVGQLSFQNGHLHAVSISAPQKAPGVFKYTFTGPLMDLKTRSGIGLGSPLADFKDAYPEADRSGPVYYVLSGKYLTSFGFEEKRLVTVQIEMFPEA